MISKGNRYCNTYIGLYALHGSVCMYLRRTVMQLCHTGNCRTDEAFTSFLNLFAVRVDLMEAAFFSENKRNFIFFNYKTFSFYFAFAKRYKYFKKIIALITKVAGRIFPYGNFAKKMPQKAVIGVLK